MRAIVTAAIASFIFYLLLAIVIMLCSRAYVRAEPHDHATLGNAGEFYSKWNRPKGNFSGIQHRKTSCCNRTDCSPVDQVEIRNGQVWARLEHWPGQWYRVDPSIIESNQEDPRDSPDGRSHGCVIGGVMACFVEGGGI